MRDFPLNEWFLQPDTESRMRQLPAPYDGIWVGSDPLDGFSKDLADLFKAMINVSHTECALFWPSCPEQRQYWICINELGRWPYSSFATFYKIMNYHFDRKETIYVHCHAGAYRSPGMLMSWLWYRGHTLLEAAKMVNRRYQKSVFDEDKEETEEQWLEYWSRVYLRRGNWPQDLEEFNVRLKGARNQDLLSALLVPSPLNESDEVRALGYDRQKRLSQANKGQP